MAEPAQSAPCIRQGVNKVYGRICRTLLHIDGLVAGEPDGRQRQERAPREASVPTAPLTDLDPATEATDA